MCAGELEEPLIYVSPAIQRGGTTSHRGGGLTRWGSNAFEWNCLGHLVPTGPRLSTAGTRSFKMCLIVFKMQNLKVRLSHYAYARQKRWRFATHGVCQIAILVASSSKTLLSWFNKYIYPLFSFSFFH